MSLLRFKRSDVWYTLLLVGIAAALAGFVAALLAIRVAWATPPPDYGAAMPADYRPLLLATPLASAVLGPMLWWWLIIKPGRLSLRRGIAVGALIATIAHPVVWYIALVLAFLTGQSAVAGILVTNPLQDLLSAIILAIVTLIVAGWLTALVGGVIGGVIALLESACGCWERVERGIVSVGSALTLPNPLGREPDREDRSMPMPLVSLLAIPINNPFPVTLALSIASIFAFGIELAIARLRIHPSKWVYVLLAACMALAAILMAWSGYYALYGPPAAEPITHFGMPGTSHDFYLTVWKANVVAFLVTGLLVLVMGIALARRKA